MMEDWQKNFWDFVDTVTLEVEQFFTEVNQTVTTEVERFWEDVDEVVDWIAEEVEQSITPEIEECLEDLELLFEQTIIVYYAEFDELLDDADFSPFEPRVTPNAEQYAACIGCRHYHGQVYGDNLLVCGMHPYGWEGETCPDWES